MTVMSDILLVAPWLDIDMPSVYLVSLSLHLSRMVCFWLKQNIKNPNDANIEKKKHQSFYTQIVMYEPKSLIFCKYFFFWPSCYSIYLAINSAQPLFSQYTSMVAATMITSLFLSPLQLFTFVIVYHISHLHISHLHCLTSSRFKVEFTV